jgi:hypothetical protein
MKPAFPVFALLAAGGLSIAFADPPVTPVAPESASAAAPKNPAEDSAAQQTPANTAPATPPTAAVQTAATAAAKPGPTAPDERMQEALLRYQGYKLSMVRGEEKWCRREVPIGSHLASVMRCITVQEAEEMAREGRLTTEQVQRNQPACLQPAAGGCGK